ncbi:phage baseplate assembly protein V [Caballeronia sp. LZ001]|uniref:phage baseplate assembly protein V n=2 Tax=Caballeronia TaxID=1827195 RepID=UPI002860A4DA|nr:phage baseplate assembly protein V [Caballeronia sp. LZ001]MDR5800055.1 phage baseplate assembly protein V [Caballeronia sp. LZ001]
MHANEFRRLLINLIRKGSVAEVDLSTNPPSVRVSVGDPDDEHAPGLTTNWLPFATLRAGKTRAWNPPSVGEQVILLCPMGDPAQGVVWGGILSGRVKPPTRSADVHATAYPDGALIQYDHAAHTLSAKLPEGATIDLVAPDAVVVKTQKASIESDDCTLKSKLITLDGDVVVSKSMTVAGAFAFQSGMSGQGEGGSDDHAMRIDGGAHFSKDVTAAGVSVEGHLHRAQGSTAPTSKPIKGASFRGMNAAAGARVCKSALRRRFNRRRKAV